MIHIFHDWAMDMTYDEVIHTCRICKKEKREPWYPVMGWCRPPRMPKRGPINPEYIELAKIAYDTVLQTMLEGEKDHPDDEWKYKSTKYHKRHALEHAEKSYIGQDKEDNTGHCLTRNAMIKYIERK